MQQQLDPDDVEEWPQSDPSPFSHPILQERPLHLHPLLLEQEATELEWHVQALLPLVQEAVGASEVVVPEGLDEKKGMDLIEAILQRRQGPAAAASKKHKEKKTAEIVVADSPESPKEASKVAPSPIGEKKKRERVLTPKAKAGSEVANKK